jgi:hypothetical protein
MYAGFFTNTV